MKTTFGRTLLSAALILLAALLLIGTSFRILTEIYLEREMLDDLTAHAQSISQLAAAYYTEDSLSNQDFLMNLTVADKISGADAVICNSAGKLILCSDSPLGCQHQGLTVSANYLSRVLSSDCTTNIGMIQGLYEDVRFVAAVPIKDAATGIAAGIVIVSSPTTATTALLEELTKIFLVVSLTAAAVAVLVMAVLTQRQSAPLRGMAKTAIAFAHGNLDARVKLEDSMPDEIQELALSFNNMASILQKNEYQRQEFVANVSHELKTPMTTIGGYVDGMLDGTIPPEKHRQYMQLVSDETKRLSRLVRSMLDISRLQDQEVVPEEKKLRFDMEECAGQVLITFEQKINAKNLDVQVDMPEHPVYTSADQDAITQVVYNLVDNAVKFSPQDGVLGLQIRESGSKIYVTVSNTGQTIPPEELPLVFDRFHKLDKSRSQNRDGWGLGLYIVKTIVCSHGEDISVSSAGGKTAFTFTLPLVN